MHNAESRALPMQAVRTEAQQQATFATTPEPANPRATILRATPSALQILTAATGILKQQMCARAREDAQLYAITLLPAATVFAGTENQNAHAPLTAEHAEEAFLTFMKMRASETAASRQ